MSTLFTTENLKGVFAFPFKDQELPAKLLILFLMYFGGFLIVPMLFVSGYQYEIMRRIIVNREEPSLPEWEDWGTLLKNGAKFWGVTLIYFLPLFAFFIIPFGLFVLAGIGIGSLDESLSQTIPFFFFHRDFIMEFGWDILYQCDEHYQHCGIRAYDRQRRIRGCLSGQRLVADLQEKHLGVRDRRVDIKRIFLPDRVRRAVPGLDFFPGVFVSVPDRVCHNVYFDHFQRAVCPGVCAGHRPFGRV